MRNKVRFISGDSECAAWHYPGSNVPFLDEHERAVEAELAFLSAHLLERTEAGRM
jgi:hypothetical protein